MQQRYNVNTLITNIIATINKQISSFIKQI